MVPQQLGAQQCTLVMHSPESSSEISFMSEEIQMESDICTNCYKTELPFLQETGEHHSPMYHYVLIYSPVTMGSANVLTLSYASVSKCFTFGSLYQFNRKKNSCQTAYVYIQIEDMVIKSSLHQHHGASSYLDSVLVKISLVFPYVRHQIYRSLHNNILCSTNRLMILAYI